MSCAARLSPLLAAASRRPVESPHAHPGGGGWVGELGTVRCALSNRSHRIAAASRPPFRARWGQAIVRKLSPDDYAAALELAAAAAASPDAVDAAAATAGSALAAAGRRRSRRADLLLTRRAVPYQPNAPRAAEIETTAFSPTGASADASVAWGVSCADTSLVQLARASLDDGGDWAYRLNPRGAFLSRSVDPDLVSEMRYLQVDSRSVILRLLMKFAIPLTPVLYQIITSRFGGVLM